MARKRLYNNQAFSQKNNFTSMIAAVFHHIKVSSKYLAFVPRKNFPVNDKTHFPAVKLNSVVSCSPVSKSSGEVAATVQQT